jgi:ribosome-binding protein aMBF1 (putative translation factor)
MRKHKTWSEIRDHGLRRPAAAAAYEEARLAYEIGRQVRELREAQGLSQTQLASRMGTTQSVIARLEAGGSKPTLRTLERAAAALRVRLNVHLDKSRSVAAS